MPTSKGFEVVRRAAKPLEVHNLRGGSLRGLGANAFVPFSSKKASAADDEAFRAKYAEWLPRCGVEGSALFWSLPIDEREAKMQLCISNFKTKQAEEDRAAKERAAAEARQRADAEARQKAEEELVAARLRAEEEDRKRREAAAEADRQNTTGNAAANSGLKTVLLVGGGLAALGLGFMLTRAKASSSSAPVLGGYRWRSRRHRR